MPKDASVGADEEEQLGTSHAQDKENPGQGSHRSNKEVLVLAPSPFLFLLFLQVKKIKRRTLIRKISGLTPEESPKKDRSSSPGLSDLSGSEYEHARKHPITKKDVLWQEGMLRNTMLYHTQGHASRTNTWGTVPEASDVSLSEQHRATSSARGRVSNNLQDDQDPVLIATGKVKSLQPIRRDILKSADSLRLRNGQKLMVFHRINYLDQNAVVRNATVYTDGIVEDAYERGTDRSVAAKARQAQAIKAPLQLLRRNSPNIPMSVSGTALVKRESAVTGGSSTMMLMRTPDGKIADLRKQKEAV